METRSEKEAAQTLFEHCIRQDWILRKAVLVQMRSYGVVDMELWKGNYLTAVIWQERWAVIELAQRHENEKRGSCLLSSNGLDMKAGHDIWKR